MTFSNVDPTVMVNLITYLGKRLSEKGIKNYQILEVTSKDRQHYMVKIKEETDTFIYHFKKDIEKPVRIELLSA